MDIKRKVTNVGDDILLHVKEQMWRTFQPTVKLARSEDGLIKGWVEGPLGPPLQHLVDYYLNQLNQHKVIKSLPDANIYSLYHPPFPSPAADRAVVARSRDAVFKLRTPCTNTMAVTYKCQCNCVHCSAEIKIDKSRQELTTEEWKKVIDDSCKIGIYGHVITGGEPCLRPDLPEIIAHVTRDKGVTLMFTNGLLLKKRAKELADAGLYALNVSIDDINPEVHNQLRRTKNCFELAMEGAAAVRELGILTGISTYATREKIRNGDLEKLIQIAREQGFIEVTIFDPMPSGKWMHDTSCVLDEDERKYLRELNNKYRQLPNEPGVITQSYINSPHGEGCFGGYNQVYITAYGDINPCDFNPVTFGNVRDEGGLFKAWYKMTHHGEYRCRRKHCRMQNPAYRHIYIDSIPENAQWPIPIEFYENRGNGNQQKEKQHTSRQGRQAHQH